MFCAHCGFQISNNSLFCCKCGYKVALDQNALQSQMKQFQLQKNAIRQSEINSLKALLQYFSLKKNQFNEYDNVYNKVAYYAEGAKVGLLVWGCIVELIFIFSCFSKEDPMSTLFVFLIILAIPGLMMIAGGILMLISSKKQYTFYKERYAILSQELYEYYMNFPNCPIGPEFVNPDILEIIMKVLVSGRADTIKESINIIVSDADKDEFDDYLKEIAKNTADINARTGVPAVFASASFFK